MPAGEKLVKCHKCGADLRSEQKVCIKCGTRTIAGGNYEVHDKEAFQVTRNMKIAAAAAALLVLVAILVRCLQVTPPNVVAQQWFDAMAQREINKAVLFHSPDFTANEQVGVSDPQAISDRFYEELNANQGKETLSPVTYDVPGGGATQATVNINLSYPDGTSKIIQVTLKKIGRKWLIDRMA